MKCRSDILMLAGLSAALMRRQPSAEELTERAERIAAHEAERDAAKRHYLRPGTSARRMNRASPAIADEEKVGG